MNVSRLWLSFLALKARTVEDDVDDSEQDDLDGIGSQ